MLEQGNTVFVLAPLDEYIEYKEKFPEVRHVAIKNLNRDNTGVMGNLNLYYELKKRYKEIKPDIILHYTHKPNIFGGCAAGKLGIKSLAVVTGLGYPFLRNGWLKKIFERLYRFSGQYHQKVIFENEDDLNYFIKEKIIPKDKGQAILGCGVDTKMYMPYPNGHVKEKQVFTFIGRLLYDKGIVEFIEAAKEISTLESQVEFWIVGELDKGNPSMIDKSKLLEWIDEGHIVYHGFVKDVRPLIAKSDCVVLPSYREGMPRIILEAMSMAKPVITTDTAGCRQTVEDGENGFLVKIKDAKDLQNKMRNFLKLPHGEKHEMGMKGRQMAEVKFDSEMIANQLYNIISTI